ncbi:MAG TPA: glycine cleavage system aminomethyltransferase GcvT, partial [Chroococcales cyanobacterium]
MVTTTLKETPLANAHRKAGARMVDFAGWNMPVQYKSIVGEHMAVRTKVGLFDVSHMGEFTVEGEQAKDFIQHVIANDLNKLASADCALYTQMVMPTGGTVDDLIVYRRKNDYLLVVNASNIEKDWNWLNSQINLFAGVKMKDISDQTALLALQGPHAVQLLADVVGKDGERIKEMGSFTYGEATVDGTSIAFGRTGYTGEDGFEIFVDSGKAEFLWNLLLEKGQKYGIEPCGLGARDTLRLEAGLPLYGHELDEETSPLQAGLGWSVKLDKGEFLGREAMQAQKRDGLKKQCVCLKVEGKALPRQGYDVYSGETQVGQVTSGSQGIFVGFPIAFAFVPPAQARVGTP